MKQGAKFSKLYTKHNPTKQQNKQSKIINNRAA